MRRFIAIALLAVAAPSLAHAEESVGAVALAVAALVAEQSPHLSAEEKALLAGYLDSRPAAPQNRIRGLRVEADRVRCRAGNVDIIAHSCELTFGAATVRVEGRRAHELFATLIELGVQSEGAAGSVFVGVSHLQCTIDTVEIADRAGAGARCRFTPAS